MELSAKTEAFLANFAKINQNMLFLEGNTIKTMSEARNVLASANIEENIPKFLNPRNFIKIKLVTKLPPLTMH